MAITPKRTRKKSATPKVESQRSSPRYLRPISVDLHSTELSSETPKESAEADRGEPIFKCIIDHSFFINRSIESSRGDFNVDILMVTCKSEREPSKLPTEKVQATYICAFERGIRIDGEDNLKLFYEEIIAITVWPKFKELLGLFVVQGNSRIPKPPLLPKFIEWKRVERRTKTDNSEEKIKLEKS